MPVDTSDCSPASVRLAAMNFLARREHSADELRQKLARRFDDQSLIEVVLQRLAEENLQSDLRFAEAFVAMRYRQGKGPLRINHELSQKGVSGGLIDRFLDASDERWTQLAREVRERRFGSEPPREPKDKARQMRFLQYRGFSGDQIRGLF